MSPTAERLGCLILASAAAACANAPRLESPVGELHRAPSETTREHDIFAEQFLDTDRSALTDFRDVLAPHGSWVDDPRLGTVWLPAPGSVSANFTPYATDGRWTYGQGEYVWVSDAPWGWVTFHYGRWMRTLDHGWAWIPGRRYSGAWVIWRTGDDGHVGWGPAPAGWYWQNGVAVRTVRPTVTGFVYAKTSDLFAEDLSAHLIGLPEVLAIASRTQPHQDEDRSPLEPGPGAPEPSELGIAPEDVTATPATDPSLQRAWLFARPSGAQAAGIRPLLPQEPARLKEWVAGGPRYLKTSAR